MCGSRLCVVPIYPREIVRCFLQMVPRNWFRGGLWADLKYYKPFMNKKKWCCTFKAVAGIAVQDSPFDWHKKRAVCLAYGFVLRCVQFWSPKQGRWEFGTSRDSWSAEEHTRPPPLCRDGIPFLEVTLDCERTMSEHTEDLGRGRTESIWHWRVWCLPGALNPWFVMFVRWDRFVEDVVQSSASSWGRTDEFFCLYLWLLIKASSWRFKILAFLEHWDIYTGVAERLPRVNFVCWLYPDGRFLFAEEERWFRVLK